MYEAERNKKELKREFHLDWLSVIFNKICLIPKCARWKDDCLTMKCHCYYAHGFSSLWHSKLCPWTWAAAASGAEETAGLVSMAARPPLTLAVRAPPRGPLLTFLRPPRGPASLLQWTRLAPRWWLSPSLSRNPSPADTTCILPVSTLSACRMRATTKTAIWHQSSRQCVYCWEDWTVGKPLCCVLF